MYYWSIRARDYFNIRHVDTRHNYIQIKFGRDLIIKGDKRKPDVSVGSRRQKGKEGRKEEGGGVAIVAVALLFYLLARAMIAPTVRAVFPAQAYKYWNFPCNKGSTEEKNLLKSAIRVRMDTRCGNTMQASRKRRKSKLRQTVNLKERDKR